MLDYPEGLFGEMCAFAWNTNPACITLNNGKCTNSVQDVVWVNSVSDNPDQS